MIEQTKFTYSLLGKAFEKQMKAIEDQGEKQIKALEEHGKQLVESSGKKWSLIHLKQKETFEELANKRIHEIQNLSKQIDFNNIIYYFKGESAPKNFIGLKGPLAFYKNIKDGYMTLENTAETQKEFKSLKILKRRNKSEEQKSAIKSI